MEKTEEDSRNVLTDCNSEEKSAGVTAQITENSLNKSSTDNDEMERLSQDLSNDNTTDKPSGSTPVTVIDSLADSPATFNITSGFDSADSMNDEDFLDAKKGVLSAIGLIEDGLKEDSLDGIAAEKSSNISIFKDKCETASLEKSKIKSGENDVSTREVTNISSCQPNDTSQDLKKCDISAGSRDLICKEGNSNSGMEEEKTSEVSEETNQETVINDCEKEESIKPLNNKSKEDVLVENKISNTENTIQNSTDSADDIIELNGIETLSKEMSHFVKSDCKVKEIGGKSSKNEKVISTNSKEICSKNRAEVNSVSQTCKETELEKCSPTSDNKVEANDKSDDSDDIVMLKEIQTNSASRSETQKVKSQITPESTENVELDLYDEEISVLKYKDAKDETKMVGEFKLDNMVPSSDEDSDVSTNNSENCTTTVDSDVDSSNIAPPIPDTEETSAAVKSDEENNADEKDAQDDTKESHCSSDSLKNEGMDLDELSADSIVKRPEETTKMDVDLTDDVTEKEIENETTQMDIDLDNSYEKEEASPEPNSTECSVEHTDIEPSILNPDTEKRESLETTKPETDIAKDEIETKQDESDVPMESDEVLTNTKNEDSNETCASKETDLEDMLKTALLNNEKFKEDLITEDRNNKETSECATSNDAEVICLVDDDDDVKKKPPAAVNCVNPNCMSGEELAPPASIVLSYFGLKRSKGQKVCAECFEEVIEHDKTLTSFLAEQKPLLSADYPSHKDVISLDSDEEELSDNEGYLSDETMSVIRDNLDDLISESLAKYDFDYQLRESCNIINKRLDKLEKENRETAKKFETIHDSLNLIRDQIYEEFKQERTELEELQIVDCEIPPLPIRKPTSQNQMYNKELSRMRRSRDERQERENKEMDEQLAGGSSRVVATKKVSRTPQPQPSLSDHTAQDVTYVRSEAKCEPPSNLPSPGPLVRPKLRVGDLAYTMKVSYFSIWVHCRILEVIPRNPTENDPSTETYRVRIENVKKNSVRTVTGKYLAYPTPARVQLRVGVRVIAIFKEEEDSVTKDNYYVGVIAEPPKSMNKYRYLVFFDDGYTQYCPHENILVVCATSKNVWEDIHPEPREFIRNYLQQYPERPMVKLSQGQIVKVEWNGRWWIVRVLEVDGSLVKVHFDADRRTEWIYRGSTRLGPMYQELAAAKERQHGQHGTLLRSRGFGGGSHHKSDMPYVEYTRGDGEGDNENKSEEKEKTEETVEQPAPAPRSVARKSTAKKPASPTPVISNNTYCKPLISYLPEGRVRQRKLRPRCRPLQFRPHKCNEACIKWTGYSPTAAKKYDPLVKPLIFGFERLIANFKGKSAVHYRAPCGRMLRSSQEMLTYLTRSKSNLTIDLFDFDFWVNPLAEFEEGNTFGKIEDLSYGKENVRISCVNELDHSMPQYVQYLTAREPAKDVNLNLDPEFLVGCDCTDNCEDRTKCSCWKLTLQGKAYQPDGDLDPLFGYQYRRLPERIATGIYECNSRCKCKSTCQNRVAQQPLSCRLQLFKTLKKGWGIRCLHDIPRGAFICIYAGFLLTEQEANEGGKTYGDEYLAELDYIESVENLKEGYESEAKEPSDFEDDNISQKDTMDIEYEHSEDSADAFIEQPRRQTADIKLRLRRRTMDEAEKESRKSRADDDAISISDDELDSGQCGGCRENIDSVRDSLRCQGCMKSYHFKCTPLKTSANVDKLGSNKSSWVCPRCDALVRKPQTFDANITVNQGDDEEVKYPSVRELYGPDENVYIMDAKTHGNIGRYLNHSCSPNVFVQNVFVDTHDLRFPWVAFFANQYIAAGTELTWDYNYDVGSVPGKVMLCYCGSNHCRGRLL
ncbi:histone-lysine N-methyltransferase eggless isoform X2 [Macrosteles quadrilineatus]|uniref:histone-lysine N-methyltransferase eggless isoform X2 n=1 Tax=Macrosteles quadrilineatus TaxID=74068 RepID=UPI0023E2B4E6|nr:histone-lysine N-methyltransferase eggless isoform X2 [Macrosteles quadrilineatus]